MMKVCYTGWTWIKSADPEVAKEQLAQSFRECKFLGYDYVENFAFIRDYYKDNPEALVQLQKDCGVELVNLYGHFTFDVEESRRRRSTSSRRSAASGTTARTAASATTARASARPTRR